MIILACDDVLSELVNRGDLMPVIAVALGCTVAVVAIISTTLGGVMKTRAVEESRRELAAYVAEGSMSPEDAVAMINAGRSGRLPTSRTWVERPDPGPPGAA